MAKLALDPIKVACFNAFWATRHQEEEEPVIFSETDLADLLLAMANSEAAGRFPGEWSQGSDAWERAAP